MCREEAQELSSLKSQLDESGFRLYAVVHESLGVPEFKPFFNGEVFLDAERRFFGPHERWASLCSLLRPSVWRAAFRARGKNVPGNMEGEGRLLGGVFVIGPGSSGILFEYQEKVFGDHASLTDIMDAVKRHKPQVANGGDS